MKGLGALTREELLGLDQALSRRAFFRKTWTTAGLLASAAAFQGKLKADTTADIAYAVMGAVGNIVIPVDEDPGYATFEPGISRYCLDGFVKQVVLAGDENGFGYMLRALNTMNEAPSILENGHRFLEMNLDEQEQFYTKCFTGTYENDG